eukprot:TRINITY_DN138_c0_g1_i2.p1 TRINITY_DN138_c0_g1~~TRINITY_DN138_c0_g1_i2.p1  ORF type:complete len:324 (+),score=24.26 TRINITY_DN138_c0_g1_i2:42-1013(+)
MNRIKKEDENEERVEIMDTETGMSGHRPRTWTHIFSKEVIIVIIVICTVICGPVILYSLSYKDQRVRQGNGQLSWIQPAKQKLPYELEEENALFKKVWREGRFKDLLYCPWLPGDGVYLQPYDTAFDKDLRTFVEYFAERNAFMMPVAGSALGAYRNGGPILNDRDQDLIVVMPPGETFGTFVPGVIKDFPERHITITNYQRFTTDECIYQFMGRKIDLVFCTHERMLGKNNNTYASMFDPELRQHSSFERFLRIPVPWTPCACPYAELPMICPVDHVTYLASGFGYKFWAPASCNEYGRNPCTTTYRTWSKEYIRRNQTKHE